MKRRGNAFRINYANIPKKPNYEQILAFLGNELELVRGEVLGVQCSRSLACAFVETVDEETARRVCEKHDSKHEVIIDGKKFPLQITLEDGAVQVKLTDLSESVSNDKIKEFLEPYGDVIDIQGQTYTHSVFGTIKTGVRLVKMVVKKNIESFVTIDGETTMVSYYGQRLTCRHCREYSHVGATCVQNKKLLVQKSYADATKEKAFAKPKPKSSSVEIATNATSKPKPTTNTTATAKTKLAIAKVVTSTPGTNNYPKQQLLTESEQMPPPATTTDNFPALLPPRVILEERASTASLGQRTRSKDRQSDGNETDESTTSSDSTKRKLRPPAEKKQKQDNNTEGRGKGQQ